MRRAFHYTHLETYNKIKRDGILAAKSPLISPSWISSAGNIEMPDERYIFSFIDTPEPEGWKKSGFLDQLLNEYLSGGKIVLLSFPLKRERAFVLEARPTFDLSKNRMTAPKAFKKYVESMMDVKEYSGEYKMPELVVAGNIPIERITLEDRL